MAWIKLGRPNDPPSKYIGLSSAPKPPKDPLEDIPDGSTAKELDTGKIFTWSGTAWEYGSQEEEFSVSANELQVLVLWELVEIHKLIEMVTA